MASARCWFACRTTFRTSQRRGGDRERCALNHHCVVQGCFIKNKMANVSHRLINAFGPGANSALRRSFPPPCRRVNIGCKSTTMIYQASNTRGTGFWTAQAPLGDKRLGICTTERLTAPTPKAVCHSVMKVRCRNTRFLRPFDLAFRWRSLYLGIINCSSRRRSLAVMHDRRPAGYSPDKRQGGSYRSLQAMLLVRSPARPPRSRAQHHNAPRRRILDRRHFVPFDAKPEHYWRAYFGPPEQTRVGVYGGRMGGYVWSS